LNIKASPFTMTIGYQRTPLRTGRSLNL
jgi:hypothetical protein